MPCSGRRGNRASEVEVGLLGLPRQNIEPSSLQEKLHVDLTGQGSRGKRHRGKAESPETGVVIAEGEGYGIGKHGLGLRAPFRAARRSTSCINWVCRSARMPHRRRRFLWANQAWCGAAFGISVAFRMSTNSVPSLVRVLCAVIENETGYRRLSRFPARSPALQRLAKKNGTWDLGRARSDDGPVGEGQAGPTSSSAPSAVGSE